MFWGVESPPPAAPVSALASLGCVFKSDCLSVGLGRSDVGVCGLMICPCSRSNTFPSVIGSHSLSLYEGVPPDCHVSRCGSRPGVVPNQLLDAVIVRLLCSSVEFGKRYNLLTTDDKRLVKRFAKSVRMSLGLDDDLDKDFQQEYEVYSWSED